MAIPEPHELPAKSWSARLAALISHGASQDDPRVECRAALAYHRGRCALDTQTLADLEDPQEKKERKRAKKKETQNDVDEGRTFGVVGRIRD